MSDLPWNCSSSNPAKLQPSLLQFPKYKIKATPFTEARYVMKPKTSLKKNRENKSYHMLPQHPSNLQKMNEQYPSSKSFRV